MKPIDAATTILALCFVPWSSPVQAQASANSCITGHCLAFELPNINCLDLGAIHDSFIHEYACPSEPKPKSPAGSCGVERWAVKTLADPAAADYAKFTATPVEDSSIPKLVKLSAPTRQELMHATTSRFSDEVRKVRVQAVVLGYKLETDSDFHIVLGDPDDPTITMVSEIPSPACAPERWRSTFTTLRAQFVHDFAQPIARYHKLTTPRRVTVMGVFFFDFLHGQTGVAPNGAEIHPILQYSISSSR